MSRNSYSSVEFLHLCDYINQTESKNLGEQKNYTVLCMVQEELNCLIHDRLVIHWCEF